MAYRRTERVAERLAQSREALVEAALEIVRREGFQAASVAAVARAAGVATGSVYSHFPSKAVLLAEVFRRASQREIDVLVATAAAADGGAAERLAAVVEVFARRSIRGRRIAWALLAEPVAPEVEAERLQYRRFYASVLGEILRDGVAAGELPEQDVEVASAAIVGAIAEALLGPLSPQREDAPGTAFVAEVVRFCVAAVTARSDVVTGRRPDAAAGDRAAAAGSPA